MTIHNTAAMTLGRKGDVSRQMLWMIVLLILLLVIVALVYGGAWDMIHNIFINEALK